VGKLSWFKHYNTASEGQLIGDLIANKDYEAALLVYVILELVSQFEDPENRGFCTVPLSRIARRMNMKPSRIERVMGRISSVSRSDLICTMDEKQPRNASFLVRNWPIMQENRGGKTRPKLDQKLGEVRSKKEEERSKNNTKGKTQNLEIAQSTAIAERQKTPDNSSGIFIGCYVKAFQQRYSTRPDLNGKRQGQIKALVKGCENFEELCQLVQVYCQSDDPWFVKKMHDIQTFAENIGKVRVMMNNGVDSTKFIEQKAKEQFWDKIKLQ